MKYTSDAMMTSQEPRVLISTVASAGGGVWTMTRFIAGCLAERGYLPVIAYYEPFSLAPDLSVPSWHIFRRCVRTSCSQGSDGFETHAIGAWLPELEFTHYLSTRLWNELIDGCQYHIAVSGSAHPLMPFYQKKIPCLGWIATGWAEDVATRATKFSWPRRVLDTTINAPVMLAMEKRILNRATILALSEHTQRTFNRITGRNSTSAVLPMPVDTSIFRPKPKAMVEHRLGFSARLNDPRKNIDLLLKAVSVLKKQRINVSLDLIGGELDANTESQLEKLGIGDCVNVLPFMSKEELAAHLQTLDVYVLPSHQEGLCIAALEAMASGCPVVSTRCGGPEEFVIDDETGFLVNFDADEMAAAIAKITCNRRDRARLAAGARQLVERRYNREAATSVFWGSFKATFAA